MIIVNDGSTDNTLDIINHFEDSRIKIITQDNHGPGAARNNALEIAEDDNIMYLDSDDWFYLDALEGAYAEITRFNEDLTFFKIINYDGDSDYVILNEKVRFHNYHRIYHCGDFYLYYHN